LDDAAGPRVRSVVAARAVVALDAGEVALELQAIEDFVVVDGAPEEPEELGARRGRNLVFHVAFVDLARPFNGDGIDCREAGWDRAACAKKANAKKWKRRRETRRRASNDGGTAWHVRC